MGIKLLQQSIVTSLLLLLFTAPLNAETVLAQRYYPVPFSNKLQVGTEELRDNYSSLAGLEGLYVDFSVVQKAGISKGIEIYQDLENRVREKIQAAGLKMITEEEITATPGLPMLNLWPAYSGVDNNNTEVRIDENQCRIEPFCRTSLWAGYSESASILRRPGKYHRLSTWGSGDDTNSCSNRGEWMSKAVLEKVDLFLSDYKKAQQENQIATVHQEADVPNNCHQTWVMHLDIFATNQTTLSDRVKPILDKLITVSNNCPDTGYTIETHADTRADENYNKILTVARAHSIKDYLMSKGLPFSRIRTRPMGESQPITTGTTEEDHAANRRVVVLPSSSGFTEIVSELEN